jgi:hypothetical protein
MLLTNELLLVFVVAIVLIVLLVWLIPAARRNGHTGPVNNTVIGDYTDKGVVVSVDWQGYPVKLLRIPSPPLEEIAPPVEELSIGRTLLNVVVARADDPDTLVTRFDPPLTIRMAYTQEDLERARRKDLTQPYFCFWDGCNWIRFTQEKHHLSYDDEHAEGDIAGYATVQLSAWNDPLLASGP